MMEKLVSPQGVLALLCWIVICFSWNDEIAAAPVEVQIVAPYIELHTGPGRGYPVFHVATRGELVEIQKNRADWYKVRTGNNKVGWVTLEQLSSALTKTGEPFRSSSSSLKDYLTRRVEVGAAGGELENDPMLATRISYFWHRNMGAEIAFMQVAGALASSQLYSANIVMAPFSAWRFSPFFSVGIGRLDNRPKQTLVDAKTSDSMTASAGIGIRTYLTRRFIFRTEVSTNTVLVDDNRTEEFIAWSGGFSFFIQ